MTRYAQNGGLTRFDTGGTHEQSPISGIPIGNNNSVEQGESKSGNFIYSNRIFLDDNTVSQYNLPKSLVGKSVADASKLIDNKFKGRNDKISQSTKNSMLSKIAEAQEAMKPQEPEMEQPQEGVEQQLSPEMIGDPSQMALGGYTKRFDDGGIAQYDSLNSNMGMDYRYNPTSTTGPTINTSDNAISQAKINPGNQNMNANTLGAVGTAVGSAVSQIPSGALDKKYSYNNSLKAQDDAMDKVSMGVSAAFPIAGLFFGAQKLGLAAGEAIGGEKGRDITTGILDPSAGQREVLQSKDSTQFEKGVSLAAPFLSGIMAGKARDRTTGKINSQNALNYNRQFSDQYALGGEIDPPKKDVRKQGDLLRVPADWNIDRAEEFIPTTNKVIDRQKRDPLASEAAAGFKDWYTNPITAEKFAKNTGFDKNRLQDFVQRGLDTPSRPFKPGEELDNSGNQMAAQYLTPSTMNKLPKGQILYDSIGDPRTNDKSGIKPAIGHEFTHASTMDTVLGRPLAKVLGDPFTQGKNTSNANKRYISRPEEGYGNFHQFRLELGLKPGQKVDETTLKQLVKDKKASDNMFYQTYDDDKIVKAINTIASTKPKDKVNYAAYGGKLKQMGDGGNYYQNNNPYFTTNPGVVTMGPTPAPTQSILEMSGLKPSGTTVPYTIGTQPTIDISNANRQFTPGPSNLDMLKYNAGKVGTAINQNAGNLARYAPIAANAYQLSQLKKPQGERLERLGNRYKPSYVDMAQQQNIVNQELNNTNSAIQQSGASQGQSRAAMLGSQLNKTKALSNAYMNAEAQNAQQDAIAQQFNLGVDQTNLAQSTLEKDINARNQGTYDTEKSRLIGKIGENIGNVGNEQAYKKIAITTTGYNWIAEYQKANPTATAEEAVTAAKKAGVIADDNKTANKTAKKNALGGYLIKNKVK